ncbi:MAG TPA: anti-anti-sigma factor [Prolixibacteraceae bacterium]|jgi:anti-sigma B factor antagonist|nr:anti-anti-sigma factor [Prolixibacteraceae bacterium]
MNIKKEKTGNFTVLKIKGRIDTVNSSALEAEVKLLFDSGENNLIFNCSGMDYISSSGLRVFLVAQKKAISINGKLYLSNMQPAIQEIFRISGFSNLFKIFDTQEEVIEIQ